MKNKFDMDSLFDMSKANWIDGKETPPKNNFAYIIKYKDEDDPCIAVYADGWFKKPNKKIEKFCKWPK